MADVEFTEAEQRKLLESGGWFPLGELGEGGGARVFRVVPFNMIQRLATIMYPHDHDTARKHAPGLAELLAGAIGGTEVLVAAAKVNKKVDDRIKREVEILTDIQHPNLVRLLARDPADLPAWYVMPVMKSVLKDRKDSLKGDVVAVLRGMLDVVRALVPMHLHQKRIVHRDIKPSNVFVGDDGRWILTDPGVAFRDDGQDLTHTRVWSKDWSPTWPDDKQNQSPKVDLYSLAATALWVLVDEKPLNPSYLDEPEYNLPALFPSIPAIEDVFALFRKLFTGPKSKDVPYENAAALVPVLEQLLSVVGRDPLAQLRSEFVGMLAGLRAENERLRRASRLLFSYAHSTGGMMSGPLDSLTQVPLWLPDDCDRLVFWCQGVESNSCGILIQDDSRTEKLAGIPGLQNDLPTTLELPPGNALRGRLVRLTVTGRSGLVRSLMVWAERGTPSAITKAVVG